MKDFFRKGCKKLGLFCQLKNWKRVIGNFSYSRRCIKDTEKIWAHYEKTYEE